MGIALQIIGVLILIISLVFSILTILNKAQSVIPVLLLIVGGTMIRIGREIYKNNKKP